MGHPIYIRQGDGVPVSATCVLVRSIDRAGRADLKGRLTLERPIATGTWSLHAGGVGRDIHVLDCRVVVERGSMSVTAPFAAVDASEWAIPPNGR